MDPIVSTWIQMVARWLHVLAGVIWIGFLFFFALVQLDALSAMGEARRSAARQLIPRALWWFRWMSALTVLTGLTLLGMIYYLEDTVYETLGEASIWTTLIAVGGSLLAIVVYDQVTARVRPAVAAHLISIVLLAVVFWLFDQLARFDGRATWIHVGSVMGLALFVNVWLRVWPAAKKRILPALQAGSDPDPVAMSLIERRARRSVYIAVPLLFLMISNHYPILYGSPRHAIYFAILVSAGWLLAAACLRRASGFSVQIR